jgi:predicted Zn-dependent protease
MLLTRDESKKLIDKVLSFSKSDETTVTVGSAESVNIRTANNTVTTSGRINTVAVNIACTRETRTGAVAVSETTDEALRAAVAKAEQMAQLARPNPEHMPVVSRQDYPKIDSFDENTARSTQKEIVTVIQPAIEGAAAKRLLGAGYIEREARAVATGNSKGNFGYATRTGVDYSLTVRTQDGTGSGWGTDDALRLSEIDGKAVAERALQKAEMSQKPRRLEPGKYTVVLEPAAAADFIPLLFSSTAFSARAADEGRSLMTKRGGGTRVGEKMFVERISVRTDPFDQRNPGFPWIGNVQPSVGGLGGLFFNFGAGEDDGLGFLPNKKITWIEKGAVKNLVYSRYWAQKKETEPTPSPTNLVFEGEDHLFEDLIRSTDRGLLVTRFWYIRTVNPQTVQLTGLTRDGLFMIEKGKIAYPVMNFRWNESPAVALANVEMMSRPTRIQGMVIPAMKIRDFTFTSISDAV